MIDAIRARHVPRWDGPVEYCAHDDQPWPCDTAIVLAALDYQTLLCQPDLSVMGQLDDRIKEADALVESAVAALEREARLRAALDRLGALPSELEDGLVSRGEAADIIRAALATEPEGE